jgi:hypothetical protein
MERGCGFRVAGAIYIEVPTSPYGLPIEHFIIDPPVPIDPVGHRVTAHGVFIKERPDGSGVHDVWDWVGSSHYPNVADVIEEARRLGVSRRAEGIDYALLSADSRLFLLHERAILTDPATYRQVIHEEVIAAGVPDEACPFCPKQIATHEAAVMDAGGAPNDAMCAGLWWHDVTGGEVIAQTIARPRHSSRRIGGVTYRAHHRPADIAPDYTVGLFASFPVMQITVVHDAAGGKHETALTKVQAAGVPVVLAEE